MVDWVLPCPVTISSLSLSVSSTSSLSSSTSYNSSNTTSLLLESVLAIIYHMPSHTTSHITIDEQTFPWVSFSYSKVSLIRMCIKYNFKDYKKTSENKLSSARIWSVSNIRCSQKFTGTYKCQILIVLWVAYLRWLWHTCGVVNFEGPQNFFDYT